MAFLCSDQADWVSGQIFGTGGERVVILEQPKYGTGMYNQGGWGVDDLVEHFEGHMKKELEPLGIMKRPYPFYDGVKPPVEVGRVDEEAKRMIGISSYGAYVPPTRLPLAALGGRRRRRAGPRRRWRGTTRTPSRWRSRRA